MSGEFDDDEHTMVASRAELASSKPPKANVRPFLLVAVARHNVGRTVLVSGPTVVGRGNVDVSLDEEGLSRRHARFALDERGQVTVEDLASTNGTFVNGERVSGVRVLHDGDRIEVGTATILKLAFQDELQEAIQRRLYEQATRDGLTGAYNKQAFGEMFAKEVAFAARHKRSLALIILDVDHFKRVNDGHGHAAGDFVLRTLAESASSALRTEDVLSRWGGEEFAVLLRDVDVDAAVVCAERIRATIERHVFTYQGKVIPITVSLGVAAMVPSPEGPPNLLFDQADACLYEAKGAGRNRVIAALVP